jgi:hypothetical protein
VGDLGVPFCPPIIGYYKGHCEISLELTTASRIATIPSHLCLSSGCIQRSTLLRENCQRNQRKKKETKHATNPEAHNDTAPRSQFPLGMRKLERNAHPRRSGNTSDPPPLSSSSTSPLPPSSLFSNNSFSSSTSLSSLLQSSSLKQQKQQQQQQQQDLLFKKLKSIDQKISTLSKKSTSLPRSGQGQHDQDTSFLIDTKSIQITSCPNCYQTT